jgi:hypothetical protein
MVDRTPLCDRLMSAILGRGLGLAVLVLAMPSVANADVLFTTIGAGACPIPRRDS